MIPMPQLPHVPIGADSKASMLIHFESLGAFGSDVMPWLDGTGLPMQFGRSLPRTACSVRPPTSRMVRGMPVRACMMAETFHPPRIASVSPPHSEPHFMPLPNGSS